ncbi:MAG: ABC transporter permease [Ilumatobacteraceae bacterium]|nr:ABC transporter permease [Ilumatobacteraceae bacterium]
MPGLTQGSVLSKQNEKVLSPRQMALRRFVSHKAAVVSCIIIGILALFVILAPFTARYGVNQSVQAPPNSFLSPRSNAWLGTDDIGRDLYSRLIYGVRVSLLIGLASALISVTLGALVGAVAGFRGGKFDDILMRVTDLFLAFPFLVTLLVVRNVLGGLPWLKPLTGEMNSVRFIIVLFSIFGWMGVARIVRGQVLSLKEREFVEAARAVGASRRYIIARHLLPNSVGPIMVALTFSVVGAIIGESTLAFFGYGPQAGDGATSLGILVGAAKGAVQTGFWWLAVFPCLMLIIIALSINFIGDALRDATDPRLDRSV